MLRRLGFMKALVIQLELQQQGRTVHSNPLIVLPDLYNTAILWFGRDKEISAATIRGGSVLQVAKTVLSDELSLKAACAASALGEIRQRRFQIRNILQNLDTTDVSDPVPAWLVQYSEGTERFSGLMLGAPPSYVSEDKGPDLYSKILLRWEVQSNKAIASKVTSAMTIEEQRSIVVSSELRSVSDLWLRAHEDLQEVRREVDATMLLVKEATKMGLIS